MIKKFIFYYFILFLGFITLSWQIWARFFRERLPRDIPDPLFTELRFWVILFICVVYIYTIKNLIKPKDAHIITQYFSDLLYKHLLIMDNFIKYNKYLKYYYYILVEYLINKLNVLPAKHWIFLVVCFQITPRIILISIFFIDIFFFNHLEYFYKFVFLGIIPLIYKYFIYSIKDIKKHYIEKLDLKYDFILLKNTDMSTWGTQFSGIYHRKRLNIKEFVDFKIQSIKENLDNKENIANTIKYDEMIFAKDSVYLEYEKRKDPEMKKKLSTEDYDQIKKDFYLLIPEIIKCYAIIEIFNRLDGIKKIKYTKILIYSIYILCWTYYVYASYKTYPITLEYPSSIFKSFTSYILEKNLYDVFTDKGIKTNLENLLTVEVLQYLWLKLLYIFNNVKYTIIKAIISIIILIKFLDIDKKILQPKRKEKRILKLIKKKLAEYQYQYLTEFFFLENINGMKQVLQSYFFKAYVSNENFIKNYIKNLDLEDVDEILEESIMQNYNNYIKKKRTLYSEWLYENYNGEYFTKCARFLIDYSYNQDPANYDNAYIYEVLNDIVWEDYMKSTDCIESKFEWVIAVYHELKTIENRINVYEMLKHEIIKNDK